MSSAPIESLRSEKCLITIGGLAGTGKGELGRGLAEYYKLPYTCGGDIFRSVAENAKITPAQFEQTAREICSADKDVDAAIWERGQEYMRRGGGIIESRRSRAIFPHSTSVLLVCSDEKRFSRIMVRDHHVSLLAARDATLTREEAVDERFSSLYGGEILETIFNPALWNFIINTSDFSKEQVLRMAIAQMSASHLP